MSISPIPGSRTLLIGPSGSGKTRMAKTIQAAGLKVRALFVDPNFSSALESSDGLPGLDCYRYISTATQDWASMISTAKQVQSLSNESLQKLTNIGGDQYHSWIDILQQCNRFRDTAGQDYGDVATWGTDTCLFLDGLSGLSDAARQQAIGAKPVASQPDWGNMMGFVHEFVKTLCRNSWCHIVLVAHVENEQDLITGGTKLMASPLGRKLAPQLPKEFTDVILCKKVGSNFTWSTTETNADLKTTNIRLAGDLQPDFKQLLDGWQKRGGVIAAGRP